jgi:hypothetical protein
MSMLRIVEREALPALTAFPSPPSDPSGYSASDPHIWQGRLSGARRQLSESAGYLSVERKRVIQSSAATPLHSGSVT